MSWLGTACSFPQALHSSRVPQTSCLSCPVLPWEEAMLGGSRAELAWAALCILRLSDVNFAVNAACLLGGNLLWEALKEPESAPKVLGYLWPLCCCCQQKCSTEVTWVLLKVLLPGAEQHLQRAPWAGGFVLGLLFPQGPLGPEAE